MNVTVLEARRFTASYNRASDRTVKDYEIDLERIDGRRYIYNGVEYTLLAGDVLIRQPGGVVSAIGEQDTYILTIDLTGTPRSGAYSRNISGPLHPSDGNTLVTDLPPIIHPRDTASLMRLYKTLINIPDRSSAAAKELACELIHTLNAELAHKRYENIKPKESAVDTVVAYMTKNLGHSVTLEQLAALVHLEKSYLVRLFRKETGKTPIGMLVEMRLDKASDLVAVTDARISEIAAECGYNTVSFFISEYKKRYGLTPEAHRSMLTAKN